MQRFCPELRLDPDSGQLLRACDSRAGVAVGEYAPGSELEWNSIPLRTRLVAAAEAPGEHVTVMRAEFSVADGAGAALEIRRTLVAGGVGLHSGRAQNLDIQCTVTTGRLPMRSRT